MARRRRRGSRRRLPVAARTAIVLVALGLVVLSRLAGSAPPTAPSSAPPTPTPAAAPRDPAGTVWEGECVGVTDGDTLKVLREGAHEVRIRLNGIDAPEKAQPYGSRAKRQLSGLVFGKRVRVHVVDHDRYGRTVAEVRTQDGRSANEEQVRAGCAWWYRQYAPKETRLEALETEARAARRGLWADKEPIAPWEWRKRERPAEDPHPN